MAPLLSSRSDSNILCKCSWQVAGIMAMDSGDYKFYGRSQEK